MGKTHTGAKRLSIMARITQAFTSGIYKNIQKLTELRAEGLNPERSSYSHRTKTFKGNRRRQLALSAKRKRRT